jgi:hypothetical protein
LKIKPKNRHSDTVDVIEAESQAVLNTLTEHNFQDEFKMAKTLKTVHSGRRELLRGVWVVSKPKVSL